MPAPPDEVRKVCLKRQFLPGISHDGRLSITRPEECIRVRDRSQSADGREVRAAPEIDVIDDGVSRTDIAVVGENPLDGTGLPNRTLDQHLRVVTGVYHRVA